MANMREIRTRIDSVKDTMKITNAMVSDLVLQAPKGEKRQRRGISLFRESSGDDIGYFGSFSRSGGDAF